MASRHHAMEDGWRVASSTVNGTLTFDVRNSTAGDRRKVQRNTAWDCEMLRPV